MELVCLDDVHAIAGDENWEQALFDLFNRVRDCGNTLFVSGKNSRNGQNSVLMTEPAMALLQKPSRLVQQYRYFTVPNSDPPPVETLGTL